MFFSIGKKQSLLSIRQRANMSKPIDIDNSELVFYQRQKRIVEKLLKVSAEEIASIISQLVVENCNGCMTEHLSQTHHQCLTMERDERLCLYFDHALEKASETKVVEAFTESLSDMKVHDFKLIEYTADDWKTIFCVKHMQAGIETRDLSVIVTYKRHDASTDFIHCWTASG
jgi:hypothetical protein